GRKETKGPFQTVRRLRAAWGKQEWKIRLDLARPYATKTLKWCSGALLQQPVRSDLVVLVGGDHPVEQRALQILYGRFVRRICIQVALLARIVAQIVQFAAVARVMRQLPAVGPDHLRIRMADVLDPLAGGEGEITLAAGDHF